jgi:hypothetical protein
MLLAAALLARGAFAAVKERLIMFYETGPEVCAPPR